MASLASKTALLKVVPIFLFFLFVGTPYIFRSFQSSSPTSLVYTPSYNSVEKINWTPINGDATLAKKKPKCTDYHTIDNDKRCHFIETYCKDINSGGLIPYLHLFTCDFSHIPAVAYILIVFWLILMLLIIGTASDEFLSPTMKHLSESLNLSHTLAGVTFLSVGNGAADISASYAAFQAGVPGVAFGALLGAGMFVTSVVVGSIAYVGSFQVTRRPFLRDIGFYIISVSGMLLFVMDGKIQLWESLMFFAIYGFYVCVVVGGRFIYQSRKSVTSPTIDEKEPFLVNSGSFGYQSETTVSNLTANPIPIMIESDDDLTKQPEGSPYLLDSSILTSKLLQVQNPVDNTSSGSINIQSVSSNEAGIGSSTASSFSTDDIPSNPKHLHHHYEIDENQRRWTIALHSDSGIDKIQKSADHNFGFFVTKLDVKEVLKSRARSRHHSPTSSRLPSAIHSPTGFVGTGQLSSPPEIQEEPLDSPNVIVLPQKKSSLEYPVMCFLHWIEWYEKSTTDRILFCIQAPFLFLLSISIPHIQDDPHIFSPKFGFLYNVNWYNIHQFFQPIFGPIMVILALALNSESFAGLSIIYWVLIFGSLVSISVFIYRWRFSSDTLSHAMINPDIFPDSYFDPNEDDDDEIEAAVDSKHYSIMDIVIILSSFAISIAWIMCLANEIVSLLKTLGILLSISPSLLGLTVLAWANSISDLVADVAISKNGRPLMGLAACYASPLLNVLLGIGIGASSVLTADGHSVIHLILLRESLYITIGTLLFNLIITAIYVPLKNWYFDPTFGKVLIGIYVIFMIISVTLDLSTNSYSSPSS